MTNALNSSFQQTLSQDAVAFAGLRRAYATWRQLIVLWIAILITGLALSSPVQAQRYAIGQKVMCDGTDLNKYYMPGVIVPFHPGEMLNGEPAGSGYFYRVRFDDPALGETPCKVTSMKPVQSAVASAARPAASAPRPAMAATRSAAGTGGLFGTRPATSCPPPVRTRPTMTQIRALVQCRLEGREGSLMYLVADLTIEAGATRPYNYNADSFNSSIDPAAPVLPLRGGYIRYQCSPVAENPPGRNCTTDPEPHARGECYRTTFGNWDCNLQGIDNDLSQRRFHQPPPR